MPVGLQIQGYETPLNLGEQATILCTYDLDFTCIEWMFNGRVVVNSTTSQADLVFDPVSDMIHNLQYTCRVITAYGIQSQTISVQLQGMVGVYNMFIDSNDFNMYTCIFYVSSS